MGLKFVPFNPYKIEKEKIKKEVFLYGSCLFSIGYEGSCAANSRFARSYLQILDNKGVTAGPFCPRNVVWDIDGADSLGGRRLGPFGRSKSRQGPNPWRGLKRSLLFSIHR